MALAFALQGDKTSHLVAELNLSVVQVCIALHVLSLRMDTCDGVPLSPKLARRRLCLQRSFACREVVYAVGPLIVDTIMLKAGNFDSALQVFVHAIQICMYSAWGYHQYGHHVFSPRYAHYAAREVGGDSHLEVESHSHEPLLPTHSEQGTRHGSGQGEEESGEESYGRLETYCDGVFCIVAMLSLTDVVTEGLADVTTDTSFMEFWKDHSSDVFAALASLISVGFSWLFTCFALNFVRKVHATPKPWTIVFCSFTCLAICFVPWSNQLVATFPDQSLPWTVRHEVYFGLFVSLTLLGGWPLLATVFPKRCKRALVGLERLMDRVPSNTFCALPSLRRVRNYGWILILIGLIDIPLGSFARGQGSHGGDASRFISLAAPMLALIVAGVMLACVSKSHRQRLRSLAASGLGTETLHQAAAPLAAPLSQATGASASGTHASRPLAAAAAATASQCHSGVASASPRGTPAPAVVGVRQGPAGAGVGSSSGATTGSSSSVQLVARASLK